MKTVILCVLLDGDIPCVPFPTMEQCTQARSMLTSELVLRSDCGEIELYAPEIRSPIPRPRP